MEGKLKGRCALITGGGRGVGAACARKLAREGARVVLAARSASELQAVAAELQSEGREVRWVAGDVSQEEDVAELFRVAREAFGPVEILVNNAGLLRCAPLVSMPLADWEATLAVNLTGAFLCARAALEQMLPLRRGVILNVASVSGVAGVDKFPGLVAYAASKGGLLAFSEALAAEVKGQGVRVAAISPGSVNTAMLASVAPEAAAAAMDPADVARVVAFLASDEAAAVHQANLLVWGRVD